MFRYILIGLVATILFSFGPSLQGRGKGGGFGGGSVGGGGGFKSGAVGGPYGGGGGYQSFKFSPVVGPAGGSFQSGSKGGSYTTQGGSTINYKGAGAGVSGPYGGAAGKGVGGVQVTTPGGQTATKAGKAGGVSGPGGTTIAGKSGVGSTYGPYGSGASHYQGGVAIGPQGGVVGGGSKVSAGVGAGGKTYVGGSHGAVGGGPYGAVGGGYKGGVVAGPGGVVAGGKTGVAATGRYGTYYASSKTLAVHGSYVRQNFAYHNAFSPTWYARYPGAWFAAGWTAARIWSAPAWGTIYGYCGYPAAPVYYDYGTTVVYQGDTVYVNGESAGSPQQYAQQAEQLAGTGQQAVTSDKGEDWQPLGVFALVQGEEKNSYNIFQLAINQQGIIKGNYYNALTDTSEPISGSVDSKTQRAAWSVGKKKTPIYEAGIANLTKEETTVLVHFGEGQAQQFILVRMEQSSP